MTLEDAIAGAIADAEAIGVNLDAEERGGTVWINDIRRTSGRPGAGAQAITLLIAIADEHEVAINGAIVRDHDVLTGYYEQHGFRIEGRDHKNRTIIGYGP